MAPTWTRCRTAVAPLQSLSSLICRKPDGSEGGLRRARASGAGRSGTTVGSPQEPRCPPATRTSSGFPAFLTAARRGFASAIISDGERHASSQPVRPMGSRGVVRGTLFRPLPGAHRPLADALGMEPGRATRGGGAGRADDGAGCRDLRRREYAGGRPRPVHRRVDHSLRSRPHPHRTSVRPIPPRAWPGMAAPPSLSDFLPRVSVGLRPGRPDLAPPGKARLICDLSLT